MIWIGCLGVVLAALLVGVAGVRGLTIPPEGELSKAITFDLAIGLFWLTLAFIVPLARFSAAGVRRWLFVVIPLSLYAYAIETVQILRGIDPRFTRAGGPVDMLLGTVFGGVAVVIVVVVAVLAVKLARQGTSGPHGPMLLALRYAMLATMVGFGAGIWMSVNQGSSAGEAGNILPLHAAGFHALQAIPILAWLFCHSPIPDAAARRWIHGAGTAWIVVCLALAWQTALGRPVTELSPAMTIAMLAWLVWLVSAARALQSWWTARTAVAPAA